MERLAPDVVDALKRRNDLSRQISELTAERRLADEEIRKKLLEDFGSDRISVRYGPDFVRISGVSTNHSISREGQIWLSEFLARDSRFIQRLFNLASVSRFAALRELMDDYSDGGWEAFEAEFVTYTDRAASGIDFVPADRAPKFLQDLDDLEVWVGR